MFHGNWWFGKTLSFAISKKLIMVPPRTATKAASNFGILRIKA